MVQFVACDDCISDRLLFLILLYKLILIRGQRASGPLTIYIKNHLKILFPSRYNRGKLYQHRHHKSTTACFGSYLAYFTCSIQYFPVQYTQRYLFYVIYKCRTDERCCVSYGSPILSWCHPYLLGIHIFPFFGVKFFPIVDVRSVYDTYMIKDACALLFTFS